MLILIPVILILAFVTIFSLENALPITVSFFFWKFNSSLAAVIFFSVLVGMLIMFLIFLWLRIRSSLRERMKSPEVIP
ncbi:MAG: LapA family protein [Deltaproteobacteria bacterium]|nr:LapA family protein [Deltaproteobacteria bacterium]